MKSENPAASPETKTTNTANKGRGRKASKGKPKKVQTEDETRFAEIVKQNEEFKMTNQQKIENREKAVRFFSREI